MSHSLTDAKTAREYHMTRRALHAPVTTSSTPLRCIHVLSTLSTRNQTPPDAEDARSFTPKPSRVLRSKQPLCMRTCKQQKLRRSLRHVMSVAMRRVEEDGSQVATSVLDATGVVTWPDNQAEIAPPVQADTAGQPERGNTVKVPVNLVLHHGTRATPVVA